MTRTILAWAVLLLISTPAFAQTKARYGIAIYNVPSTWSRSEKDNLLTFTSPDKTASITLAPSKPLTGTLEQAAEEVMKQAREKPDFQEGSKPAGGPHNTSGGQFLGMTYSYADPAQPGKFKYDWVVVMAGGGRYLTFTTVFNDKTAYDTHGPNVGAWVNGITLTTLTEVERGNPPLTRYMIDEVGDFLDWLMQSPLTDAQKTTVENEIREFWKKDDRKEIDGIAEFLKGRQELAAMKPAEREVARQALLEEVLKQWRNDAQSPAARMMVAIYDDAHKPIAPGNPPLTQQNVDAFAEFICFAARQTAGTTTGAVRVKFPKEMREKLAADLGANYANLPDEQKALIARMPLAWAAIRLLWAELPEAERNQYVEGWKQSPQLVELGKQLKASEPPLAAASSSNPMANYVALQAQQQHFQMMSNMMQQFHETRMIMNSNLGGNTSYQYRWR
jgi:hypothetical protein